MYYLVNFNKDWADEFSVHGFRIFPKATWEHLLRRLKHNEFKHAGSWYFGTNEGWDDETVGDFLQDIEVVSITDEEKATIERVFGENEFGHFPDFEEMLNQAEED